MDNRNKQIIREMSLNKNSVFIDGGAHKGEELAYLSEIGCEVHSFEINPYHIERLQNEYSKYQNININHCALWVENADIDVYYKKTHMHASMSTEACKHNIDINNKISVKAIDISEYILSLNKKISVLKMDIEGGEYKVINHLIKTKVIDKIEKIYFEDHENKMLKNDEGDEWRREKKQVLKLMKNYPGKFKKWH